MNAPKRSRKLLLLVIVAGIVVLVAAGAVIVTGMTGFNGVSQAQQLHIIPPFKDIGKTESGLVNKYDFKPFGDPSPFSTEAITLLQVIDPAPGVNNVDIPDPGTRFVAVEFKVADTGNAPISIGFGLFSPLKLIGSDGQTYNTNIMSSSKTTPNCPAFDDSSSAQIAPGHSVTGCLRFGNIPTSVKIIKFTYTFIADPSQKLFAPSTPETQTTAVWSSQ